MGKSFRVVACSAAVVLLSFSAVLAATPEKGAPDTSKESFVVPAAPAPQDPNTVLAVVDGNPIKAADIESALKTLDPKQAQSMNTPEGRRSILDDLIDRELFFMKAKTMKLDEQKAFREQYEPVVKTIMKNLARNFLVTQMSSGISVTDDEAKEFYQKNPALFADGEQFRMSHIILNDEQSAKKVLDEIRKGLSFEEANDRYSLCPNKANEPGGDIGWNPRGRIFPELERVALSLKKGEVGGPVKAANGWNLVKLTDRKGAAGKPFEEVKDSIKNALRHEKIQKLYADEVKKLREEFKTSVSFPAAGAAK